MWGGIFPSHIKKESRMVSKKSIILMIALSIPLTLAASKLPRGPNHLQAAPKLTSAKVQGSKTVVIGTLQSICNTCFVIQFFNNPTNRGNDLTEGLTFLGQKKVRTDKKGTASFTASVLFTDQGTFVSATATRLHEGQLTDTSEFSKNVVVTS
jgi:hypothetical protein